MTVQQSATHCKYSPSSWSNSLLAFRVAISFLESDGCCKKKVTRQSALLQNRENMHCSESLRQSLKTMQEQKSCLAVREEPGSSPRFHFNRWKL